MKLKTIILTALLPFCSALAGTSDTLSVSADSLYEVVGHDIENWYAQQFLTVDYDAADAENPLFPDSVYKTRLDRLPTTIHMPYNSEVRRLIDYYTTRIRRTTCMVLGLFPLYEDIFVDALYRYGLPLELKYLPVIESALKPKAYSPMGAAGMWQFIYSTGRRYGLTVNSMLDDRYDIRKATEAAARHLKDLYDIYQDWALAISAYNCGTGNINKAITRSGSRDFWTMYPYLPRETRSYLPSFIAVNYVMEYYQEHNLKPAAASVSPATDTIHITRNLHLGQISDICGISRDEVRNYNPQYIGDIIPGNYRECVLTLPTRFICPLLEAGDSLYTYNYDTYFPKSTTVVLNDAMTNRKTYVEHKIRNGETLSGIAAKYHTTVRNIKSWNNMSTDKIRAGKVLKIYNR